MTRLISASRSSPVFSSTKAFRDSLQPSLKLVESAEIQISRTGVLGEITNLASSGSSKRTSSFPASPSTSKPCSSPRSEEHTSELQSPDHLVCRLLLEKKKAM